MDWKIRRDRRNPEPNCQRSTFSTGTRQNPTLVNSDQSRLSPEPGRTPAARLLLARLSRDLEDRKLFAVVNANALYQFSFSRTEIRVGGTRHFAFACKEKTGGNFVLFVLKMIRQDPSRHATSCRKQP